MVATRPNLAHVVRVVNKFMHNPSQAHWNAVKHVFRYLMSRKDYGILFNPNENSSIVSYTDSNFAGRVDIWKSTTRYYFKFDSGVISWKSKLHECTTTSTTEVEYTAALDMPKEALWLGWLACTFRQANSDLALVRCEVSLRSGLRHFRENRPRENIHNR